MARFDAQADSPSPAGHGQAEGGYSRTGTTCTLDFRLAGSGPERWGGRRDGGFTVPQHKDLKRLVRARMDETGGNYTQALTALLSETGLDPLPDGWHMSGSRPTEYEAGLLPRDCAYGGKRVIELRFRASGVPDGFGTVMQSIGAALYQGRRVRFSAVLRGREVTDWAGIWLRVDTVAGKKVLDNMQDRPLRGTTGWTEAANVLDVGEDATSVHFGVLLGGAGAVDLARPRFEVVGTTCPYPDSREAAGAEPKGLDFGAAR